MPLCLGTGSLGLFRWKLTIQDNSLGRAHVHVHFTRMQQVTLILPLIKSVPLISILAIKKSYKGSLKAFLPSFTVLVGAKAIPPLLQT